MTPTDFASAGNLWLGDGGSSVSAVISHVMFTAAWTSNVTNTLQFSFDPPLKFVNGVHLGSMVNTSDSYVDIIVV